MVGSDRYLYYLFLGALERQLQKLAQRELIVIDGEVAFQQCFDLPPVLFLKVLRSQRNNNWHGILVQPDQLLEDGGHAALRYGPFRHHNIPSEPIADAGQFLNLDILELDLVPFLAEPCDFLDSPENGVLDFMVLL